MSARSFRKSRSRTPSISVPRTFSDPPVTLVSPAMARPMVVLPEPDSPTSPRTSPASMRRSTPLTARNAGDPRRPGYSISSPWATTTGAASASAAARARVRTAARSTVAATPSPSFGTEASRFRVYSSFGDAKSVATSACSTSRERYMTATRSARSATTPMLCVMRMTAAPNSSRQRRSRSRISACTVTSSAVVGSSATMSPGSSTSAMAMTTRCFCPPENWCG